MTATWVRLRRPSLARIALMWLRTMQARTDAIAAAGTPSELHAYDGLPHGFGLGIGTVAEGWIEGAAAFWQRQIDATGSSTTGA